MKDDNILNIMNLIPKWVWYWGLSPHGWNWWYLLTIIILVVATCWVYSWFTLLLIYTVPYFWVSRWYLLSTCGCTDPLLLCFSLLFVLCSERSVNFNSTVDLASLHFIGNSGWANASSLDWVFFFKSWCLELPAWTSFLVILFLDILV